METITVVLFLLLAVVLSDFFARLLPRLVPWPIPRPLIQVALGAVIALSSQLEVELDPDIFFLLFLPPLLFLDGWRIPREELFKDRRPVLQLAFGLVLFTVAGMGLLLHWLIPALPWALAFALAAVLSPTDPIAVAAIAQRVPMPRRMMHILEGESLLNDASGLVCFRFAVAALLTGAFSWQDAALSFLWVASAGPAVGVGLTLLLTSLKNHVSHHLGEDSGAQILISLLIPFGCYLLAEAIHASGILAAVAAGLTMSFVESAGRAQATTRIRRHTVWDVIQFTASGIIFVLLGERLPGIVASAHTTVRLLDHAQPLWLLAYVLVIWLGLAALRFAWVLASLRLVLFHRRRKGMAPDVPRGWRMVCVMSLAGVRGAVTLAAVLTLPLHLTRGVPFPARDLAVLLAMGVITLSLVAASIGLPLLLRGLELPADTARDAEEAAARVAAAHAAIAELERMEQTRASGHEDADLYVAAAARVMTMYRDRIESRAGDDEAQALARRGEGVERDMRLAALQAERATLFAALRAGTLGSETARKLIRELDLLEARYAG